MVKKITFSTEPAFINRKQEIQHLSHWISRKPNNILFIYGPKSSGKTTLLMKFINEHLKNNIYNVQFFNLRKMLISNYLDFIQAFFEVDLSKSNEDYKHKQEYNFKVFKLSKETIKRLENKSLDPFLVMEKEFLTIVKKGKCPIIIIDELQALENIYLNGQRELLKELFNFFVAMTKESHLCHVIISSSDGYFMNRIYEDSKLSKTSEFFEIDYLNEQDTKYWLSHLKKESSITAFTLTDSQIDTIWKSVGGSTWEIDSILGKLLAYEQSGKIEDVNLLQVINHLITINKGRCGHYVGLYENKFALFKKIYLLQQETHEFQERDLRNLVTDNLYQIDDLRNELCNLVKKNFLSFNPATSFYKLQGKSMFYGIKEFIESNDFHIM
ncbi:MAG: AAA family ATPase [Candidatus Magnetomorum sp.]|nr:AAA family ATPase [Candidatus Magnetomorum sp.]